MAAVEFVEVARTFLVGVGLFGAAPMGATAGAGLRHRA
jgi:hypothetical protein